MCIRAYLILRWLDASVVVLSAHNQHQASVLVLGSPHMVERLGRVPVQALLPAILLTQSESHPAQDGVPPRTCLADDHCLMLSSHRAASARLSRPPCTGRCHSSFHAAESDSNCRMQKRLRLIMQNTKTAVQEQLSRGKALCLAQRLHL